MCSRDGSSRHTPDVDPGRCRARRLARILEVEVCVCDLGEVLGITQSAVSQHLAKFKAHGLVTMRRDNQTLFYRLADRLEVKMLRKVALAGIEVGESP